MSISKLILRNKKSLLNLCSFFFSGFLSKNLQGELLKFDCLSVLQIIFEGGMLLKGRKNIQTQIAVPITDMGKLISRLGQGAKNIVGDVLKVHGVVLPFAFLLGTLVGYLT